MRADPDAEHGRSTLGEVTEAGERSDRVLERASLSALRRTQPEVQQLARSVADEPPGSRLDWLYARNLERLGSRRRHGRPLVGVWWHGASLGSQLQPIAHRFARDDRYDLVALVAAEYLERGGHWDEFSGLDAVPVPSAAAMDRLGCLDAVFFNEGYLERTGLPAHVVRIAQPHGLDIALRNTMLTYGGASLFDYILSPMHEPPIPADAFKHRVPRAMVEHDGASVVAIPTGYAKLDEFIHHCRRVGEPRRRIVYHLSNWGLESDAVRRTFDTRLRTLLERFPDHEVVFRPFPDDLETEPLASRLSRLRDHPRLRISTAPSYVEDYARAQTLITHRTKTAQTFAYATGRPIVFLDLEGERETEPTEEVDLGMRVTTDERLLEVVARVVEDPRRHQDRILAHRDRTICNPGTALDYLLEHFDAILRRESRPEWMRFELYDAQERISPRRQFRRSLSLAERGRAPYANLAEAAVARFPRDGEFRLHAAEALSRYRNPARFNAYYERWHTALAHAVDAAELAQDPALRSRVREWVATRGLAMASELREHLAATGADYGADMAEVERALARIVAAPEPGGS